jgi:hypothetical protein
VLVLPDEGPAYVSRCLISASRELVLGSRGRLHATRQQLVGSQGRIHAAQQALSDARECVHRARNVQQRALIREWLLRHRSSSPK